jgi:rhodanese-related sulfurtransferase
MERIDVTEAKRLIDDGAVLIDCREQYEWDELRIPGAKLVPLSGYENNPQAVPPVDVIVFQCAAGGRSQTAAVIYEEANPGKTAYSMDGGIGDWAAAGNPVE